MKKFAKKLNTYQLFTLIFIILCFGVFFSFIISGRSFIWKTDGYNQHYIFFEDFYNTIKNIKSGISTFSWNLGLGLDKIGQLSYYILGDPFAYLGLLVPFKYLKYTYSVIVIIRMYFAGLSFIAYCNYHKKSKFSTLIGTIIYTFSGFMLFSAVRHPFFINSTIWLPLIFLGIDKILKEDKYTLFTFISAISALSNYYFFYMITILTFIYAIIKYWNEYKENGIKGFLIKLLKTAFCYFIGVISSSILLLPTIYAFANNPRSNELGFTHYTLTYYARILLFSDRAPFWAKVSVCPLAITLIPISIINYKNNKENKTWLLNLLIYFIILLIPFLGSIMNGLSFQSNRWSFAVCFALSYLTVINLRDNLIYSQKEFKLVKNCLIIYFLLWFLLKSKAGLFPIVTAAFIFIFLIILVSRSLDYKELKKNKYFQYTTSLNNKNSKIIISKVKKVLLFSVCFYTIFFGWETYCPNKYYKEFLKYSEVESKYKSFGSKINHFSEAIAYIKEHDYSTYRIATNIKDSNNISYKYGYKGLNTYLSIGNKYISNLSQDLLILDRAKTNSLREFDSRPGITTLLGTKYYIVSKKDSSYVPYGYSLIYEIKDENNDKKTTQIYQNQNSLPITVFYNNYIINDTYKSLSPIEKEQALTKTVVIENSEILKDFSIVQNNNIKDLLIKEKEVNYTIDNSSEIINEVEKTISPKKNKNSFKLRITDSDIDNCELYLLIKGQKYSTHAEHSISVKYNNMKKTQHIRDRVTSPYYIETPNILFNLGYKDKHTGNITISFSTKKGTYTYDDIKLIAVPIESYNTDITKLQSNMFNLESFSDTELSGTIDTKEDGILQLSTSYTSGWTAYVDSNKVDIINVNTGFVGIPLSKGNHKVEFKYKTPYLELGIKLSCIGFIIMFLIFLIDIIRIRKRKEANTNG